MKMTRFEKKILGILFFVATSAIISALFLGRDALREAYGIGVNERVGNELKAGLDLQRKYIQELKNNIQRESGAVANHWRVRQWIKEKNWPELSRELEERVEPIESLVSVTVSPPSNTALLNNNLVQVKKENNRTSDTHRFSTVRHTVSIPQTRFEDSYVLEFKFATPLSIFDNYQQSGEVENLYSRLRKSLKYISNRYSIVFTGFLSTTVLIAVALGLILTRRVTRRVTDLSLALRRVGEGDLEIELPVTSDDEIGILTQAFNQMIKDLRESQNRVAYLQRINAWQQFARRLAHEIKNPLTPIQLAAQQIEHSYKGTDEDLRQRLIDAKHIIEEEVSTLRALVSEFSAFAKLPEVQLEPCDLNAFLKDLMPTFEAALEDTKQIFSGSNKDVSLNFELESKTPIVNLDAMMLKRCVDNLLRNALESIFNDQTKRTGQVTISTSINEKKVCLTIEDNGPGIEQEHLMHIFDPYFTTKPHGTGLGLPIVKKIILEHRGQIYCSSSHDLGTKFTIELPVSAS